MGGPSLVPAFEVSDELFPIVTVRARRLASDAEFEAYLKQLDAVYSRGERFSLLFDAAEASGANAAQRARQAQWIKQRAVLIAALNVGTAFVIPSALVRGLLTAMFWIQPMPSPHHVCDERGEAMLWCASQLERAGIRPPSFKL